MDKKEQLWVKNKWLGSACGMNHRSIPEAVVTNGLSRVLGNVSRAVHKSYGPVLGAQKRLNWVPENIVETILDSQLYGFNLFVFKM